MPVSIPLPVDTPRFTSAVTLDGQDYTMRLDYSEREQRWFLDVLTSAGAVVVAGCKLVASWPPLRGVVGRSRPPGMLMVVTANGEAPTFRELGRSASLLYYSAAEVDDLRKAAA
jgi:hypothetical protein